MNGSCTSTPFAKTTSPRREAADEAHDRDAQELSLRPVVAAPEPETPEEFVDRLMDAMPPAEAGRKAWLRFRDRFTDEIRRRDQSRGR